MSTATKLVNPDIDRVDAVNGPATDIPFIMFKSLDNPTEAPAEEVAKSAEEAPAEEAPAEEIAKSDDPAVPGSAAWENIDSDTALKAARDLAVLAKVVEELRNREEAEGDDFENVWDLSDAQDALSFALGILAKFALTEELEAETEGEEDGDVLAKAQTVLKALHLEVHEKPEAPAAADPAEGAAPEAPAHAEAPVHEEAAPTAKATEEPLPTGLQEILDTFVESYARYREQQDTGPAAALAAEDDANLDETAHPAPEAPPAPPEEPKAEEAPAAPEAPAEEKPAPAPAAEEKPAEAPAAHEPAPAAPAAEEQAPEKPKTKPIVKSIDDVVAEAVAKAVSAATEPLIKQIERLESMPADSGPMLSGQTPGAQEGGVVAKSLATQTAPGSLSLVTALKGVHAGRSI